MTNTTVQDTDNAKMVLSLGMAASDRTRFGFGQLIGLFSWLVLLSIEFDTQKYLLQCALGVLRRCVSSHYCKGEGSRV